MNTEKAIIAAIISENSLFWDVRNIISSTHFQNIENKVVFSLIEGLIDKSGSVDIVTLSEAIKRAENQFPKNVDVDSLLFTYLEQDYLSAKVKEYALLVKEQYVRKMLLLSSMEIQKMVENKFNTEDILGKVAKMQKDIDEEIAYVNDTKPIQDVLLDYVALVDNRMVNKDSNGIYSGLSDLDALTNGWKGGQLIVLGARPAMGKTAVSLHLAKEAAMQGKSVVIYSLEMTNMSLIERMVQSYMNINSKSLKSGNISDYEYGEIQKAVGEMGRLPIYLNDKSNNTIIKMRANAISLHQQGKCDMVIIDYLQLISSDSKNKNREQQVAEISRDAKLLAKELNIPVVLLSQLNRGVEAQADKTPKLSDLRESGAIEQDADIVMLLVRPEYYKLDQIEYKGEMISTQGLCAINLAKNREGVTGNIAFKHNETLTQFSDLNTFDDSFDGLSDFN